MNVSRFLSADGSLPAAGALSPTAQATLLLTSYFSRASSESAKPLTNAEWGRFALWLKEKSTTPADLLVSDPKALLQGWHDDFPSCGLQSSQQSHRDRLRSRHHRIAESAARGPMLARNDIQGTSLRRLQVPNQGAAQSPHFGHCLEQRMRDYGRLWVMTVLASGESRPGARSFHPPPTDRGRSSLRMLRRQGGACHPGVPH